MDAWQIARHRTQTKPCDLRGPKKQFLLDFPVASAHGDVTLLSSSTLNYRKPTFRKPTRESHNQAFTINMEGGLFSRVFAHQDIFLT